MRRFERIPDGELETLELVSRLPCRIDRVDEANRELEDRKEDSELTACRVAQFRKIDFIGVTIGVASIGEPDQTKRIVEPKDVLAVEHHLLVAAGDLRDSAEGFIRSERSVLESADGILAADEEALSLRHAEFLILRYGVIERVGAVFGQRDDVAEIRVETERAAPREADEFRHPERGPEGVNRSPQR